MVVSPLVALMQDQVEALEARGLGRPGGAGQRAARRRRPTPASLERAAAGELRLLYVAPERFAVPGFADRLREIDVGLFVVDEAHCVSQWGHDFRPDYFRLGDAARYVGAQAIVASTATATPRVAARRRAAAAAATQPLQVSTGFDRPNLSFVVARPAPHEKRALIAEALRRPDALPAIVYAGTRAGSEELARELSRELGVEAVAYHAGLERSHRADGAAALPGRRGAGDRGHQRVRHGRGQAQRAHGGPRQRAVLAGGLLPGGGPRRAATGCPPARCWWPRTATRRCTCTSSSRRRSRTACRAGWPTAWPRRPTATGATRSRRGELVARAGRRAATACASLLGHLARAGVIEPSPAPMDRVAGRFASAFDGRAAARCRSSIDEAARVRWRQYREIWAYVEESSCRRRAILDHFGDRAEPQPGRCRAATCATRRWRWPRRRRPPEEIAGLDDAIISVARGGASPSVGRTLCAEIVHGGRSQKIKRNSYDGLPAYAAVVAHAPGARSSTRVDELISEGRLQTTGGAVPGAAGSPLAGAARSSCSVSGEGTNLQAILDSVHGDDVEVVGVGASRAEARGPRARRRRRRRGSGVRRGRARRLAPRATQALGDWIEDHGAELVVLAGWMEILSADFVRRFAGRILNVHPSLLPAFPGIRAIEQALEYGVRVTGVTVHFVDEGVDTGPIVLQEALGAVLRSPGERRRERRCTRSSTGCFPGRYG